MRKTISRSLSVFSALVFGLVHLELPLPTVSGSLQPNSSSNSKIENKREVNFTVKDLTGQPWNWPRDKKGKVVLLQIWCPHCPPALAEIPRLRSLLRKWAPKGLEIIGLAVKRGEHSPPLGPDVIKIRKKFSISHTLLLVEESKHPVFEIFPFQGMPTYYLLGAQGKVLAHHEGNLTPSEWDFLESAIKKACGR